MEVKDAAGEEREMAPAVLVFLVEFFRVVGVFAPGVIVPLILGVAVIVFRVFLFVLHVVHALPARGLVG